MSGLWITWLLSYMKGVKLPTDIPVTLLTSTLLQETQILDKEKKIWVELHKSLLIDSLQIKHIITDNSGHYIQNDEPDLVIGEIRELIQKIRSGDR